MGPRKMFVFFKIASKMAAKAYVYFLNICIWYMANIAVHIRYIWLLFCMSVVNIIWNMLYSLEFDVHLSSKKIMGVISEILVKVSNMYYFKGLQLSTYSFDSSQIWHVIFYEHQLVFLFFIIFKNIDGLEDGDL